MNSTIPKRRRQKSDRVIQQLAYEADRKKIKRKNRDDEYKVFTTLFIEIYGQDAYVDIEKQVRSIMSKRGLEKCKQTTK